MGIAVVTIGDQKSLDAALALSHPTHLDDSLKPMQIGSDGTKSMRERLSASWNERVQILQSGKHVPISKVPFWIDQVTQRFNARVRDARLIFKLAKKGHGAASLTRMLNEIGIRSPCGGTWGKRVVQDQLHSKAVYGTLVVKGVEIPNYYPAIMSEGEWLALIGSRPEPRIHLEDSTHVNLFPRLLRCGHCGSPMIVTSRRIRERQYVYAACEGRRAARTACNARNWPYVAFEEAVLSELAATLSDPILSLRGKDQPTASSAFSASLQEPSTKPKTALLERAVPTKPGEGKFEAKNSVVASPALGDAAMAGIGLNRLYLEDRPKLRTLISGIVARVDLQPYEPDHSSVATVFLRTATKLNVFIESAKVRHTTGHARRM